MTEALLGLGVIFVLVPARPDRHRDGHRRLRRPVVDARLDPSIASVTSVVYESGFLHAVGGAAVHPDGQLRRARGHVAGAVPRRLYLPRPPARRAGDGDRARLRRLRRDLRLVDRDRRDHGQGRLSVDAQVRLLRRARGRLDRRRRHAGHPDPAVGHHGDLRHHDRDQYRQAVRRRHPARAARRPYCCAWRCSTSPGAIPRPGPPGERALARSAGARSSDVWGGGRAVRRWSWAASMAACSPRPRAPASARSAPSCSRWRAARYLARAVRRPGRERAHHLDAVHDPDRRADVRQLRQLHDDAGRPEDFVDAVPDPSRSR